MHTATTVDDMHVPLLEIRDASVQRDGRMLLDHLDLRIEAGHHTAIVGPNGAGKSTLVKLVARLVYPLARPGEDAPVRVFGRKRWNVTTLRGLLGIVSPALQREYTSAMPLEVFDAVVSGFFAARGLAPGQQATAAMRRQADDALQQVGAGHLAGRDMATLSSGEARRVLIARALVHRPRALLLDEPCAGLDMIARRRFLEQLRQLARAGTTLLLVTHHIEEILPEIERVVLLDGGRVRAHGRKQALLTSTHLSTTFGAPVRVEQRGPWHHASVD